MAQYTIQDPQSGKTVVVEGDAPPTEQELAQIFGGIEQTAPVQATPQPAQEAPGFAEYAGAAAQQIPAGVMQLISQGSPRTLEQGLESAGRAMGTPGFTRAAPPIAASLLFPPAAVGAIPSMLSAAFAGGAASTLAGDKPSEAVENAIISGYPGIGQVKVTNSALRDFLSATTKEALGMGGTLLAGELANQVMERGPTNVDWKKAISEVKPAGYVAPFSSALRLYGAKAQYAKAKVEDARNALSEAVGIDSPTLGMLLPDEYAQIEARVARTNPELAARINQAGKDVTSRYQALFGDVKSNAQLAQQLNQYVGRLDEEKATLATLNQKALDADAALKVAQEQGLGRFEVQQIAKDAIASRLGAINQEARLKYFENLRNETAGSLKPISQSAEEFSGFVNQIFDQRKQAANQLYAESGVDLEQRFIPVKELETAAKQALRGRSGPVADGILQTIKDTGTDGLASINEMRDMRQRFADAFAGVDPKQLNSAEALAAKAYGSITEKSLEQVGKQFGPDAAQSFSRANAYWRDTANAANSRYVRGVLRNEPSISVIDTLGNDIANGRMEEVDGFLKFVGAVEKQAPDVGKLGKQALYGAARQSFINKAVTATGEVNLGELTNNLALAARRGFPVEELGFGSAAQLRDVQKTFRKYNPRGNVVDSEALDEFYSNPLIQGYLRTGKPVPASISEPIAAKQAFTAQVREDILRDKLGVAAKNRAQNVESRRFLAEKAKLSADEQQALVNQLSADPMFAAFEKTTLGLPKLAGESAPGITKALTSMTAPKAKEIMSVMRKNRPDLAGEVEGRVAADLLSSFTPDSMTPGALWRVDGDKVRRFFSPAIAGDAANQLDSAKAILSPETFDRFQKTVKGFDRISNYMRQGRVGSPISDAEMTAGLAYAMTNGKITQAGIAAAAIDKIYNFLSNRRYALVSRLMTDPVAAEQFYRSGGNARRMMDNLTPQRAALIALSPDVAEDIQWQEQSSASTR